MKKDKLFIVLIVFALIFDLSIFGYLICSNITLKKEVKDLNNEIIKIEDRQEKQGAQIYEVDTKISNTIAENEASKRKQEYEKSPNNNAANNLDKTIFLTDFENYKPDSDEIKITETKAKEIAQNGFEESKKRIAGEGADDIDSETIKIEEVIANNYFTRLSNEADKIYKDISRKCYIIQRENEMGNGISIYVDVNTGLIIGGRAFGD